MLHIKDPVKKLKICAIASVAFAILLIMIGVWMLDGLAMALISGGLALMVSIFVWAIILEPDSW